MKLKESEIVRALLDEEFLDLTNFMTTLTALYSVEDAQDMLLGLIESEENILRKLRFFEAILHLEDIDRAIFLRDIYGSEKYLSRIQFILTLSEVDNELSKNLLEELLFVEKEIPKKVQILEALGEIGDSSSVIPIHEATKDDFSVDYEDMPLYRIGEEIIKIISNK